MNQWISQSPFAVIRNMDPDEEIVINSAFPEIYKDIRVDNILDLDLTEELVVEFSNLMLDEQLMFFILYKYAQYGKAIVSNARIFNEPYYCYRAMEKMFNKGNKRTVDGEISNINYNSIDNPNIFKVFTPTIGIQEIIFLNACKSGNLVMVKYLVECNPGLIEMQKFNGFGIACRLGRHDMVQFFLNNYNDPQQIIKSVDFYGYRQACINSDNTLIELLIANSNTETTTLMLQNRHGFLSLIENNNLEMVKKASQHQELDTGTFIVAFKYTNTLMLDYMFSILDPVRHDYIIKDYDYQCIISSAAAGNLETVMYMMNRFPKLKRGILHARGYGGLRIACEKDNVEVARYLLEQFNDKRAMFDIMQYEAKRNGSTGILEMLKNVKNEIN